MTQVADTAIIYHPAEDGDMIQFGPNCALSLEKVRGMVSESGPIVRKAFEAWLDSLKAQACADAFKPLVEPANIKPYDGGAAFPFQSDDGMGYGGHFGMSLRDYFAAKALGEARIQVVEKFGREHTNHEAIASEAYLIADAMLKVRT